MQTSPFKTYTLKVKNLTYTFLPSPSGEMAFVAKDANNGERHTQITSVEAAREKYLKLLKEGAVSSEKRFLHDCDSCLYLGTCWSEDRWYDLYRCGGTYVARYGNYATEYSSVSASINPAIYPNHHKLAHDLYRAL
jgi:hypothetical protein